MQWTRARGGRKEIEGGTKREWNAESRYREGEKGFEIEEEERENAERVRCILAGREVGTTFPCPGTENSAVESARAATANQPMGKDCLSGLSTGKTVYAGKIVRATLKPVALFRLPRLRLSRRGTLFETSSYPIVFCHAVLFTLRRDPETLATCEFQSGSPFSCFSTAIPDDLPRSPDTFSFTFVSDILFSVFLSWRTGRSSGCCE